jgi:hypothetical protein
MKELEPFKSYENLQKVEEVFTVRLRMEEARSKLKEMMAELDSFLIRLMKDQKIHSFEIPMGDSSAKVYYTKDEKETVINPKLLENMLFSDNPGDVALARRCISFSASQWKRFKQIRELCDTKGIDQTKVIKVTYPEKLEIDKPKEVIKVIDERFLTK